MHGVPLPGKVLRHIKRKRHSLAVPSQCSTMTIDMCAARRVSMWRIIYSLSLCPNLPVPVSCYNHEQREYRLEYATTKGEDAHDRADARCWPVDSCQWRR